MNSMERARQFRTLMRRTGALLTDERLEGLESIFEAWEAGVAYGQDTIVAHGGGLWRVGQDVTAQAHQPPGGEGMLAVYTPVRVAPPGTGTLEWVYGETVAQGEKRGYQGAVYECVAPGGAGANIYAPELVPAVWQRVV